MIPEQLRYTSEHEWVASPTNGSALRVGITDFAQDALGDIVFVHLPGVGTSVRAGEALGEVESTKSVSEIYAPVTATVVARNDQVTDTPELINSDPYGAGWLVDIEPSNTEELYELLDSDGYAEFIERA